MTTNQLFFALAGLMVTLMVTFLGAFAYHIDKRFEDLHRYLDIRFKAIEDRLEKIEKKLDLVKV